MDGSNKKFSVKVRVGGADIPGDSIAAIHIEPGRKASYLELNNGDETRRFDLKDLDELKIIKEKERKKMSEYDNIKTAEELVMHVKLHGGFSQKMDDINCMRDIFGRAPKSELARLANDEKLQDTFYSIYFGIWHWQKAVGFYNRHSNPELAEKDKRIAELEAKLAEAHTEITYNFEIGENAELLMDKDRKIAKLQEKLHDLKAKMYDFEHPDEGSDFDEF